MWDIEAEMRDTKTHPMEIRGERIWQPGEPIHNLSIRVTIDAGFAVREIAVAMDGVTPSRETWVAHGVARTCVSFFSTWPRLPFRRCLNDRFLTRSTAHRHTLWASAWPGMSMEP